MVTRARAARKQQSRSGMVEEEGSPDCLLESTLDQCLMEFVEEMMCNHVVHQQHACTFGWLGGCHRLMYSIVKIDGVCLGIREGHCMRVCCQ